MTDLFDIADGGQLEAVRSAGAWPTFRLGVQYWQLPDGRCVTEEEALAWLRGREAARTKKGDDDGEA